MLSIIPHQFGKFGGIGGDRCAIRENTFQIKLRADSAALPCQYGGSTNDHNGAQNARTTIFDGSIFCHGFHCYTLFTCGHLKAQWILLDIGRIVQTADQPLIERNGIALADVGDSYTGVFRHLCNQITNLVSPSMDLLAIMFNKNVSILNGQGIKMRSGNNGSSFWRISNVPPSTMAEIRLGLLEWIFTFTVYLPAFVGVMTSSPISLR